MKLYTITLCFPCVAAGLLTTGLLRPAAASLCGPTDSNTQQVMLCRSHSVLFSVGGTGMAVASAASESRMAALYEPGTIFCCSVHFISLYWGEFGRKGCTLPSRHEECDAEAQ